MDILYYPLMAIGALLLLLADSTQELERIERERISKIEARYEGERISALKFPFQNNAFAESTSEKLMLGLLESRLEIIEICENQIFDPHHCLVAKEWSSAFRAQIEFLNKEFDSNSHFVAEVCNNFHQSIGAEVREARPLLYNTLVDFIEEAIGDNISPYNFTRTFNIGDEFEYSANQYIKRQLSSYGSEDQEILLSLFAHEVKYAAIFLLSHEYCFRLPEELEATNLLNWQQTSFEAIANIEQTKKMALILEKFTNGWGAYFAYFRNNSWIYFLIFALALKFGKGVAGYCSEKSKSGEPTSR